MEQILRALLDYQAFEQNKTLEAMLQEAEAFGGTALSDEEAEAFGGTALSDEEMETVFAAGPAYWEKEDSEPFKNIGKDGKKE